MEMPSLITKVVGVHLSVAGRCFPNFFTLFIVVGASQPLPSFQGLPLAISMRVLQERDLFSKRKGIVPRHETK